VSFGFLVLLAMVLGAGYAVASDTASITVKVPGSTRSYQIIKNPDQCWGRDCYFSLVFLWSVQQYIGTSVFEATGASWNRTKVGFEQLVKAHPTSLELGSAFAYLAHRAADQPTARAQFLELGTRIDPGVWEDRTEFMEARKWSFTE
jgi:hypothetical protein